MSAGWEAVIGLEIHTQLATVSKIFSGAPTAYGAAPNTQASLIDLGYPGVLPVLNREAVTMAVRFGLATGCTIAQRSVFARKNYFYPDLPKGYQISQYELPVVASGHLDVMMEDGSVKRIGITRAHLEEDAGKSLHEGHAGVSAIDLNRAGTPLLEIVSEPDMRSAKEAVAYMKKVHTLVRYLGICDGNMQEGSFRCDANVSVRRKGAEKFGTRAELKNLNSFRFVEKAINFEVQRQIELIESGGTVVQETRLYDADRDETRSMRTKEEANDYRYFPDPDLLPLVLDEAFIDGERARLPELPDQKAQRFQQQYGLPAYDAQVLTASREMAAFYEQVVAAAAPADAKLAANWVMGDFSAALNKDGLEVTVSRLTADQLGGLLAGGLLAACFGGSLIISHAQRLDHDTLEAALDEAQAAQVRLYLCVEDEHAQRRGEGAGDGQQLLLAEGELGDRLAERQVQPQARQELLGLLIEAGWGEEARRGAGLLT